MIAEKITTSHRPDFSISTRGKNKNKNNWRIYFLFGIAVALTTAIFCRLFYLTIWKKDYYSSLADSQQLVSHELTADRGEIFWQNTILPDKDRYVSTNLYPAATEKVYYFAYAVPSEVEKPEEITEKVTRLFFTWNYGAETLAQLDKEISTVAAAANSNTAQAPVNEARQNYDKLHAKLLKIFSKTGDPYEPLRHKLTTEEKTALLAIDNKTISAEEEKWRYYPANNVGSQILGFMGYAGDETVGRYGIEEFFNSQLSGQKGYVESEKDATGLVITTEGSAITNPEDGADIVLTIDKTLEFIVCEKLAAGVKKYGAAGGSLLLMDPSTGAILAMCNYPDFDPNNYSKVAKADFYNNSAIFTDYEPGSVMKPLTMAAGINTGKVSANTTYNDTGELIINQMPIHNSDNKANGLQTMTQVIAKSLNTGAVFVARQIGKDTLEQYFKDFGFGMRSGITLATEATGDISSITKPQEIFMATASFGQGITVTPLQLLTAFGAIANNGKLMRPYIVDQIRYNDGKVETMLPKMVRQVVTEKTATIIRAMMVSAVKTSYDKLAGVPGYTIAGKTGTAQIPDKVNGGYSDDTNHTFIGIAPASTPRFVAVIKLNSVKGVTFASESTASIFGDLARFVLNYYSVPPDDK